MMIQKKGIKTRRVMAETEVAPEATDLLFEAADVAELVAEVTGEDVDVSFEGDSVVFGVGEESYTVEPEGTEEVVESATRVKTTKRPVAASTNRVNVKKNSIVRTSRKIARRK